MRHPASSEPRQELVPSEEQLRATLDRPIPALDGVRGIAILAVLMHQLILDVPIGGRTLAWLMLPLQAGWLGVQLFFVLSGFLITGILLDTRGAENYWSAFLVRRALRIFPPYYLLLILVFVVVPAVFPLSAALRAEHRHQAWYWLYLANWRFFGGGDVTPLGHCWSLALEEQFYLLWPLVVRRLGDRSLARLCVGVAIGALALRVGLRLGGARPEIVYESTLTRADALTLGALTALLVRRRGWLARIAPRLGAARWIAAAALVATALASGGLARLNPITQTVGYSVLSVGSALLILLVTLEAARGGGRAAAALSGPLLRRFGKHSYAIYLAHLPLHLLFFRLLVLPMAPRLAPGLFLCLQAAYLLVGPFALLGLGVIVYHLVEEPFLRQKRFFVPRRASA